MANITKEKQFLIAVLLTLPLPGLGHIYLRQWSRGVLWFLGLIAAGTAIYYIFPNFHRYSGLGYLGVLLAVLDVHKIARNIRSNRE